MTTIVKFVRYKDEFWPDAGEYVPLAEYRELEARLQKLPLDGDNCPVCGQPAISRNRYFDERTCGYHYWKYSEGRVVVLPPLGKETPNEGTK